MRLAEHAHGVADKELRAVVRAVAGDEVEEALRLGVGVGAGEAGPLARRGELPVGAGEARVVGPEAEAEEDHLGVVRLRSEWRRGRQDDAIGTVSGKTGGARLRAPP